MRLPKFLPDGNREWLWFGGRLLALTLLLAGSMLYSVHMPLTSAPGPLPPLGQPELDLARRLRIHVHQLATRIGQRNIWTPGSMEAAAAYIHTTLVRAGYDPARQEFVSHRKNIANIEVEIPGRKRPEEIIVLGAHYDTVLNSPGANDNASGLAALLELARLLHGAEVERTVRLVAFANEEAPFYYSDEMGSRHYARRCTERGERIKAMLSLETMGCYRDAPNSQHYPFPLSLFYPDTGNFLAFVGNLPSRPLVQQSIRAFRQHAHLPSEGIAAPGFITGIGWSDHWSFWQEGYEAIMLTDTAFFRSPHYHTEGDTEEKLDYERLARAVAGLAKTVPALAGRNDP
ncbi:M28 family peptidase [Thiovibrio sp. JS02]